MKIFKNYFLLSTLWLFMIQLSSAQSYEQTNSFFPDAVEINQENIEWGYFTVPENWNGSTDKKIKLAVAILKQKNATNSKNPILMIEGGPGGSTIETIWYWLNHSVRENSDIVLVDVRGTGFSEPRLCPDIGKEFLNIYAKNQTEEKDEAEKAMAVLQCKQELNRRGIDPTAYNGQQTVKDLHALKVALEFEQWNVLGVSYGTQIAQVYANNYPEDTKTLILDSPISEIADYYVNNTSNYVKVLNKVFDDCQNDPYCHREYPNLEDIYYKTIEKLEQNPITVKADKSIVPSGEFTYNAEDFKISIHQVLYRRSLVKLLPLLIHQFYEGNTNTLSALVETFSSLLRLDYGYYYCVTCSDVIPNNSYALYQKDAAQYHKLQGGIAFYKSDFAVCDLWNKDSNVLKDTLPDKQSGNQDFPTLVFTGGFDPITPSSNGQQLKDKIKGATLINAESYGHITSFTQSGSGMVNEFVNNPKAQIKDEDFVAASPFEFVGEINVNGGVASMGNSLNEFNVLFFAPLFIALLVLLIYIIAYLKNLILRKNKIQLLSRTPLLLSSVLGIVLLIGFVKAIENTAAINLYILAFGLPESYDYLYTLLMLFLVLLGLSTIVFFLTIKKIEDRSVIFTVLFSNLLIGGYTFYWGLMM